MAPNSAVSCKIHGLPKRKCHKVDAVRHCMLNRRARRRRSGMTYDSAVVIGECEMGQP